MKIDTFDYFIACVPAGGIYNMSRNDLLMLAKTMVEPGRPSPSAEQTKMELCLIGIVAYFESFCKNQFASAINICPQLINNLIDKNIS